MEKLLRITIFLLITLSSQAFCNENALVQVQNDPVKNTSSMSKDAKTLLRRMMITRGWLQGWDNDRKRFFALGISEFESKDPAGENNFLNKREIHAKIASMTAKAKVIEFINTEMSAEDKLNVPGTSLATKFGDKLDDAQNKATNYARKIAEIIYPLNSDLSNKLNSESSPKVLSILIKQVYSLDLKSLSSKHNEALNKYMQRAIHSCDECAQIKKLALLDNVSNVTSQFSSTIKTLAHQQLNGVTVLTQAESWNRDTKVYQSAVLVVWSPKLEKASRNILAGHPASPVPNNCKGDVFSWLEKVDLSSMTGGRQYLDSKGQRWFIGFGVSEVGETLTAKRSARFHAVQNAKANVAFSLFADVQSFKEAKTFSQTTQLLGKREQTKILQSFVENLSQKVNKNIRGLSELYERELIHPISGKKIIVSVYGVSPQNAAMALGIKKEGGLSQLKDSSRFNKVAPSSKPVIQNMKSKTQTLDSVFDGLIASGRKTAQGYNDKDGYFFVVMVKSPLNPSLSVSDNKILTETLAKKEVAAFLGQDVTAIEQSTESMGSNSEYKSTFKSMVSIGVKQCLKGAQLLNTVNKGGYFYSAYALTQRGINMASVLSNPNSDFKSDSVPQAAKGNTVIAVGIAIIVSDDLARAKKDAMLAAQKDAISQVLGSMVSGTTKVQNMDTVRSKIFTNTIGFIESSRVVSEGATGNNYQVKLRATVAKDKLYDSYKSILQSIGNPPFYVEAVDSYGKPDNELREKFSDFFVDLGFQVVGQKNCAAYIIRLKGTFSQRKHPAEGIMGTQLSLWVKMYDPLTHELLFTIKNDPRRAAVFYSDKDRQHDLSIKKAFRQIKNPLHKKINNAIFGLAQQGRTVLITLDCYSEGVSEYTNKIKSIIEGVPGVSDINTSVNEMTQVLTFKIKYIGKSDDLSDFMKKEIEKQIPMAFRPTLKGKTANSINFIFD